MPRLAANLHDYPEPSPKTAIPKPALWKPVAPQLLNNPKPSDAKPAMKAKDIRR